MARDCACRRQAHSGPKLPSRRERARILELWLDYRPVEEFVRQGRYVVALRVRANVCSNCGEKYFERDQVAVFEDVRRRLAHGDLEGFRVTGEVLELVAASPG